MVFVACDLDISMIFIPSKAHENALLRLMEEAGCFMMVNEGIHIICVYIYIPYVDGMGYKLHP